ncbi:hypothetical protein O3P69_007771 [Scylla paramamosain]|uniref:Uncharacterized protein n=1 Tax=Scylla paramamosain TaxID=85552 RepID=A0AAW0UZV5_SCYPA
MSVGTRQAHGVPRALTRYCGTNAKRSGHQCWHEQCLEAPRRCRVVRHWSKYSASASILRVAIVESITQRHTLCGEEPAGRWNCLAGDGEASRPCKPPCGRGSGRQDTAQAHLRVLRNPPLSLATPSSVGVLPTLAWTGQSCENDSRWLETAVVTHANVPGQQCNEMAFRRAC